MNPYETTPAGELRSWVLEECGARELKLDLSTLCSFAAERWSDGHRFVRRDLSRLLASELPAEPESIAPDGDLERVAGHGLFLGRSLAATLGRAGRGGEASESTCGLWNLLLSRFDEICDVHVDLRSRLFEVVSLEALEAALDPVRLPQDGPLFVCAPDEDPRVALVARLAEALFSRMRGLGRSAEKRRLATALGSAVFEVYRAERASLDLMLSPASDPASALQVLRGKSSVPLWVAALLVLQCVDEGAAALELRELMVRLGDLYWLADDLMDLEDDLLAGRTNYVVLVAERDGVACSFDEGPEGAGKAAMALQREGPQRTVVRELFSTYDEVSVELERRFGPETPLSRALFPSFSCWFMPLFV